MRGAALMRRRRDGLGVACPCRRGAPFRGRWRCSISPAYAQGTGVMDQSALVQFLPLILIFVVFYFLLIRPQQKKQKEHRAMLDAVRRGDRVVTGGGILGTVSKVVSPEEVEVDLAPNVRVRVLRSTLSTVLSKPDPAAAREAARERTRRRKKSRPARPTRCEAARRMIPFLSRIMAGVDPAICRGSRRPQPVRAARCYTSPTGRSS